MVSHLTGIKIEYIKNPRQEAEENELHARNDGLVNLGLSPTKLEKRLLDEI